MFLNFIPLAFVEILHIPISWSWAISYSWDFYTVRVVWEMPVVWTEWMVKIVKVYEEGFICLLGKNEWAVERMDIGKCITLEWFGYLKRMSDCEIMRRIYKGEIEAVGVWGYWSIWESKRTGIARSAQEEQIEILLPLPPHFMGVPRNR